MFVLSGVVKNKKLLSDNVCENIDGGSVLDLKAAIKVIDTV